MERFVVNQPAPLTVTLYTPGSETPADADASVSVTVTHVNGTVLAGPTNATHGATGVYTYTLAPQAAPAQATAVWSYLASTVSASIQTPVNIVTRYAATLAEIRALDGIGTGNGPTMYTTAALVLAREQAEAMFEQATGKAWSQSYSLDLLDGDPSLRRAMSNTDYIWLPYPTRRLTLTHRRPRSVISAQQDDGGGGGLIAIPDTLSSLVLYASGELERALGSNSWSRGLNNVRIEYLHGEDYMPADLRRAFLVYVRYLVLYANSRIPDRATSMQTDFGMFQIGQADGFNKPTGLPEVDAVLRRYGVREPIIA